MLITPQNSLQVDEVADRYGVSVQTLMRHVWKRFFPAPHKPFGRRLWLKADLDLFDRWIHERGVAEANGRNPDDVLRPEYSLPFDGPILKKLAVDGK